MGNKYSDWYFAIKDDSECEDGVFSAKCFVAFVHKDYWKSNKCLEDDHIEDRIPPTLNVSECMESIFEGYLSPNDMRTYLLGLGYIDDSEFTKSMS